MKPGRAVARPSHEVAGEISSLRGELGELVDELDRRRRALFDVRAQLRAHPVAISLAGLAVAAVLGGSVALLVYNGRRKQRRSYKARQLRVAVGRMMEHPERVGRGEAPPGEKILAAVGTAIATLLVKRALERAVPSPRARAARAAQADGHPEARPRP
ncbi:hypothetical protein [Anaeromyxobacter diazotrophicus]|uniref:hypothetical protein n=1 Tax=Anaeromyxobacter diazotrophicus TaxID=2590199 RepID=UPI001F23E571|nr:hypothetical protein [Anaeromyxobacter diazotrophicus]